VAISQTTSTVIGTSSCWLRTSLQFLTTPRLPLLASHLLDIVPRTRRRIPLLEDQVAPAKPAPGLRAVQ